MKNPHAPVEIDQAPSPMEEEAKKLLHLFNEVWFNSNHLKAMQKSDEFWFKYNKLYYTFNDEQKDIFNMVCYESTYRHKFLTEKEEKQYEEWVGKLIPDDYFDSK